MLVTAWGDRFPVQVQQIAQEYSTRFADPIHRIAAADVPNFEGALCPLPAIGKWAILYNPSIKSAGRVNFTLAHEFGHYLLHRTAAPQGFECGVREVLGEGRNATLKKIEAQADTFASYLLMPLPDVRAQTDRQPMSVELLRHCADRYNVSLTAAALKWLEATTLCAAVVVATNGFVKWCWRSAAGRKAGIFYPFGSELPADSLAATGIGKTGDGSAVALSPSVWHPQRPTREVAIYADEYEMTISLLVFEDIGFVPNEWLSKDV